MLIFEIISTPRPEKQTKYGRGRFYNPNKQVTEMIRWQVAPHAPKELFKGPLEMHLTFYLPIPKGTSAIRRRLMLNGTVKHYVRPDYDNLAYLVTNALKGLIYQDDAQVWRCISEKLYGETPKTVVKVWES